MADILELRAILKHINTHPEDWDQTVWARPKTYDENGYATQRHYDCGTACCFAGHAVLRAGYKVAPGGHCFLPDDPSYHSIPTVAERLLGLTEMQRCYLFASENSYERLVAIVNDIERQEEHDAS